MNRIFFIICYALAVWSLALSLSNAAETLEQALFWRRFAAFGWGIIYSLMLHYFLILTGETAILKKKLTYLFLYLPSAVLILFYAVINSVAEGEFFLQQSRSGWINIPRETVLDTFFNIYYVSFSLIILILLGRWAVKNRENRKHALSFIGAYLMAFTLGTLTDILGNRFAATPLPAMAPIVILLPILVFAKGVVWFGIKSQKMKKSRALPHEILSEQEQDRIFRYLGAAYVLGSLLNFGHYFFYPVSIYSVMHFGTGVFFMGFTILLLPNLPISRKIRDYLLAVVMGVSLFVLLNQFLLKYGSNIVWPVPLLFMGIAAIFNHRYLLVTIFLVSLASQLRSWFLVPDLEIAIHGVDHFLRLSIYIIGFALMLYVRKVYLKKLKDIESQIRFQRLISKITTNLVSVNQDNMDRRIHNILRKLGKYFQSDEVELTTYKKNSLILGSRYSWSRDRNTEKFNDLHALGINMSTIFLDELNEQSVVTAEDLNSSQRGALKQSGISSILAVPINNNGSLLGYLCLRYKKIKQDLSREEQRMILMSVNLISDVLSKIDFEAKINYMAFYDHLTGLPNRALFNDRVDKAISLARRTEKITAVLMMDLDAFKNVNDTMGHLVGDSLLKKVSERLSGSVRDYDTISRFGGDEFLFALSQLDSVEDVESVTAKLLSQISESIVIDDNEFFVTASIGIAVFPYDGQDAETLIKNADLAMYNSKKSGRNRYSFCSTNMKDRIREQVELTNDLYRAVENEEFLLHYQPQVATDSCHLNGLEALVRWKHPEKGIIPPGIFIPLAEQSGLIEAIGNWVLNTACRDTVALQKSCGYPIRIAVNLSLKQFLSSDLTDSVKAILDETGLEPELLELEITESIAMIDSKEVNMKLLKLKDLGISISIDDFGTQYSSLSRIKEMPVDRLKIDKQFIDSISSEQDEEAIALFIVSLSRNLGLEVIAEGVENRTQYNYLLEKGCDEIQGYFFSKPVTVEEIKSKIEEDVKYSSVLDDPV